MPIPPRRSRPLGRATSVAAAAATVAALAGTPPAWPTGSLSGQAPAGAIPPLPVDTFRLSNGLRVVVSEDHAAPVVAVSVWYGVGSAHEGEGGRGLSRLVRRLVGRGADGFAPGAADSLVTRVGGVRDATVGPDWTSFVEVLPANALDLALWLQAGRMGRPRFTDGAVETWRLLMEEEHRVRGAARPHDRALAVLDTLSQDYGPYRRTPLAPTVEPDPVKVGDVEAFHRRFYAPSNAVLTVVGAVDPGRVRERAEAYFGAVENGGPAPGLPDPPPVPRGGGDRRAELAGGPAASSLVWVAYTVPPADHPDRHAVELLQTVLGPGPGSRVGRRLAEAGNDGVELAGFVDLRRGPGTLRLGAMAPPDIGTDRVEALVEEEVERLRREGVTRRELSRAVNRRRSELVGRLLTVRGRAAALQWHAFHQASPHALAREMARYESVTAADLERVARTYLVAENRTVVVSRAGPGGAGGGP